MENETTLEDMCKIILEADNDEDHWVVWSQDDLWNEAVEIIRSKSAESFSEDEDLKVTEAFFDILEVCRLADKGWKSYNEIMEVFLARK